MKIKTFDSTEVEIPESIMKRIREYCQQDEKQKCTKKCEECEDFEDIAHEGIGEIKGEYTGKIIPINEAEFFCDFSRGCHLTSGEWTWVEDGQAIEINGKEYTITVFGDKGQYSNNLTIFIS